MIIMDKYKGKGDTGSFNPFSFVVAGRSWDEKKLITGDECAGFTFERNSITLGTCCVSTQVWVNGPNPPRENEPSVIGFRVAVP